MNYGQFLQMVPEATLTAILLIVFFADMFCPKNGSERVKIIGTLSAILLLAATFVSALAVPTTAFGGMYVTTPMVNVMKTILSGGTLIVVIMSGTWLRKEASKRVGEFYMLVISTLLGMYVMISSGHFLIFFLGLEMASVPMACLVAFDKLKRQSAEAAAKYILTATFSTGVMLYGISFIYASCNTLYFEDIASRLSFVVYNKTLLVMGIVFFFSGLAFKISLVPFHFWTADTYQGAPTPVTGYLSVVSKGAATLTLFIILQKTFIVISEYWYLLLSVVIILSITVGNLMAMRQKELKRFMAFSSISQAGYIMLAALGADMQMGATALTFYVLVYVVANLYQTNPRLSLLMTVALFSLAGIPPFAGMFSKFFVFLAAAQQGTFLAYLVVFVALVNTVVSLYYYLLIVKAMYIKKTVAPMPTFVSDTNTRLALAICTAGIVVFGVVSCVYGWIQAAAV